MLNVIRGVVYANDRILGLTLIAIFLVLIVIKNGNELSRSKRGKY